MFGLSVGMLVLIGISLLLVCAFEFINGFHDTANAVATVIYTKSLKPMTAVVYSGILNGIGVFLGGIAVAIGVINMLPVETLVDQNIAHSIGMVAAILLTAIFWNLGTWYLALPASSSHTLIGSIVGVGLAYSLLPGTGEAAVNWRKTGDVGLSLLFSPLFGFLLAMLLMSIMSRWLRDKQELFAPADGTHAPPMWIRVILILTCGAVSFSHGSNDGQKGIGLMMLVLIGFLPSVFALNQAHPTTVIATTLESVQRASSAVSVAGFTPTAKVIFQDLRAHIHRLAALGNTSKRFSTLAPKKRFLVRKEILLITNAANRLRSATRAQSTPAMAQLFQRIQQLRQYTDYAPWWVVVLIALSLALGTMIGWERIVVTIGEKIGKSHLSYAQGASAELVAASTIAASTYLGLPVSTTHVLSSGIAGAMFSQGGKDNLQRGTITKILLAWVLTLPVCLFMSGALFLLFRWLTG